MEINCISWNEYASYSGQGASMFWSPIQWSVRMCWSWLEKNLCFLMNLDLWSQIAGSYLAKESPQKPSQPLLLMSLISADMTHSKGAYTDSLRWICVNLCVPLFCVMACFILPQYKCFMWCTLAMTLWWGLSSPWSSQQPLSLLNS